jgi:hypothetical protein
MGVEGSSSCSMTLDIIQREGDIEAPTDHPHVYEEQVSALWDEDEDIQRYLLSFSGSGDAVRFFVSVLKDRIDEDIYRNYENTPDSQPTFSGIKADDIDEFIQKFDDTVSKIEDIHLEATIDGVGYEMPIWNGEPSEEPVAN